MQSSKQIDRQHRSIAYGMHTKETKKSFSRAQINCGVRARMLQVLQQTRTLSTTAVPELEHLRLDDNTIKGVILSSLLWSGRRGLLREHIGAELHASCRTAMISGPRYGSNVRTPGAADTTRSRARGQYTSPATLFPEREVKMCTQPKQGPTKSRQCVFVVGILVEARCYYRTKHDNATWGAVREHGKFLHALCGLL